MIDPALRTRYNQWWNGQNKTPLLFLLSREGTPPYPETFSDTEYWLDLPRRIRRELFELEHTLLLGDALPVMHNNFGPGVLGACMGGNYHCDRHTFWYGEPVLDTLSDIERFTLRDDNPWLERVDTYHALLLEHTPADTLISITDIGGGMDILAGLRGTQTLLMDLVTDPAGVREALAYVYRQWQQLYDRYAPDLLQRQDGVVCWNSLPAPGTTYTMQNDLSCMISPQQFIDFDLDHLRALCDRLDYPLYHLDGPDAVRHVDALLSLQQLRVIQWIPGSGAPGGDIPRPGDPGYLHWLPLLEKIQAAGKSLELHLLSEEVETVLSRLDAPGVLVRCEFPHADPARRVADNWHTTTV